MEAGVSSPVALRWFRHAGGVNPCLPPTVSGRYLSFSGARDVAPLRARGLGVREIARRVKRDPSTISRASSERADADLAARLQALGRPVARRAARLPAEGRKARRERAASRLRAGAARRDRSSTRTGTPSGRTVRRGRVATSRIARIAAGCRRSPQQIANRLRLDFPDDESMRISHEAIYQALYVESRGALKWELVACLRTGRALRVPRGRATRKTWAHVTPEVMISERPAEVEDRAVPGHWEGDLLIGLGRPRSARSSSARPASRC